MNTPPIPSPSPSNTAGRGGWIAAIVFCLFLLAGSAVLNLFLLVAAVAASGGSHTHFEKKYRGLERAVVERAESSGDGYIASIPLDGVIQSEGGGEIGESTLDDARIALRAAREDSDVVGVVLEVNSPGGEVTASDIIYNEVVELAKEKPVVVAMGSMAASGAYYIACGADYIIANETTFTGSIGVIIHSFNYEGLLGKIGVSPLVFKSGQFKDMLSGSRQPTPEEISYVQGMVLQVYDRFLSIVSRARKLSEDSLRTGAADGRILTGQDALKAGLVDAVGYSEDAYRKARELSKSEGAGILRYKPDASFERFVRLLGAQVGSKTELSLRLTDGFTPKAGVAYYLPETGAW
jgi:protease-4